MARPLAESYLSETISNWGKAECSMLGGRNASRQIRKLNSFQQNLHTIITGSGTTPQPKLPFQSKKLSNFLFKLL